MKITNSTVKRIMKYYNIDEKVVPIKIFKYGLIVELEHGTKLFSKLSKSPIDFRFINITNDDLFMTAKIVIAHLIEFPDYYQRLYDLEMKADKYWEINKKPNIFK